MKARAPGKIVLSGAYAVLDGAPALVAAVDRYVVADAAREASLVTDEVAAALRLGQLRRAVWFDASALRADAPEEPAGSRKLGLGSSAAIVVATLGASLLAGGFDEQRLGDAVFPLALVAHREAQAGGSGVDVAASCHGGVLLCRRPPDRDALSVTRTALPSGLVLEVFAANAPSVTSVLLAQVQHLRDTEPQAYRALMAPAQDGAAAAASARSAEEWVDALREQYQALAALGAAAGAPIVTAEMVELGQLARVAGACFGPAGAGGGDVALYAGATPSSARFRARARDAGLCPLPVRLGARGVHPVAP